MWMFFATLKSRYRAKIQIICVSDTIEYIQIKIKMPNRTQGPPASSRASNVYLKDLDALCIFKIKKEGKIWIIGIYKTSNHIYIKIKMPNPNQEPPASSKAPNQDLSGIYVLSTFKIKIENRNLDILCIKDE